MGGARQIARGQVLAARPARWPAGALAATALVLGGCGGSGAPAGAAALRAAVAHGDSDAIERALTADLGLPLQTDDGRAVLDTPCGGAPQPADAATFTYVVRGSATAAAARVTDALRGAGMTVVPGEGDGPGSQTLSDARGVDTVIAVSGPSGQASVGVTIGTDCLPTGSTSS